MPEGMSLVTDYSNTEIELIGSHHASVSMQFGTTIGYPDKHEFKFGGSITMLVEKSDGTWKIVSGHTSSRKPGR